MLVLEGKHRGYLKAILAYSEVSNNNRRYNKKDKDLKKYIKITETFKKEQMDNTWGKVAENMNNK